MSKGSTAVVRMMGWQQCGSGIAEDILEVMVARGNIGDVREIRVGLHDGRRDDE